MQPLVYPAGFLYVFSFFRFVTGGGKIVIVAQLMWMIMHALCVLFAADIYLNAIDYKKNPSQLAILVLLLLSRRIRSIFVLRLFNDCVATLFALIAISLFVRRHWKSGCVFFSLAVSVKMNVLLYAPGLLALMLQRPQSTYFDTVVLLSICAAIQVVLALPFLLTHPLSYLSRSFDLGRVFIYYWSVNWKFVSEGFSLCCCFAMIGTDIVTLCATTLTRPHAPKRCFCRSSSRGY